MKFGHSRSLLTTCQQWWLNPTHEPKEAESGLLPALTGRSGSINDSEVLQMFATKWIGIGTSEKKSIKLTLPGIIIGLPRNCQNCFRCKSENWLHEDSRESDSFSQVRSGIADRKTTSSPSEDVRDAQRRFESMSLVGWYTWTPVSHGGFKQRRVMLPHNIDPSCYINAYHIM